MILKWFQSPLLLLLLLLKLDGQAFTDSNITADASACHLESTYSSYYPSRLSPNFVNLDLLFTSPTSVHETTPLSNASNHQCTKQHRYQMLQTISARNSTAIKCFKPSVQETTPLSNASNHQCKKQHRYRMLQNISARNNTAIECFRPSVHETTPLSNASNHQLKLILMAFLFFFCTAPRFSSRYKSVF